LVRFDDHSAGDHNSADHDAAGDDAAGDDDAHDDAAAGRIECCRGCDGDGVVGECGGWADRGEGG